MKKKRLLIRLSSFGDIVLSTAPLSGFGSGESCDWLVSREFAEIIKGHPKVGRVWEFDRSGGLRGWVELLKIIFRENYDEIYDLHLSLRSQIAHFVWVLMVSAGRIRSSRWVSVDKWRLRRWAFFCLKRLLPLRLRPPRWVQEYSYSVFGLETLRPNLTHLLNHPDARSARSQMESASEGVAKNQVIGLMPSSAWPGKQWPTEFYLQVIEERGFYPVVFGRESDQASSQLIKTLELKGVRFFNATGDFSYPTLAGTLSACAAYFGNDTGLAHFAEAIGVPAWVVFGPTHPDAGFGPWRRGSKALGSRLWCRPCGKDGRACFENQNTNV